MSGDNEQVDTFLSHLENNNLSFAVIRVAQNVHKLDLVVSMLRCATAFLDPAALETFNTRLDRHVASQPLTAGVISDARKVLLEENQVEKSRQERNAMASGKVTTFQMSSSPELPSCAVCVAPVKSVVKQPVPELKSESMPVQKQKEDDNTHLPRLHNWPECRVTPDMKIVPGNPKSPSDEEVCKIVNQLITDGKKRLVMRDDVYILVSTEPAPALPVNPPPSLGDTNIISGLEEKSDQEIERVLACINTIMLKSPIGQQAQLISSQVLQLRTNDAVFRSLQAVHNKSPALFHRVVALTTSEMISGNLSDKETQDRLTMLAGAIQKLC